ncbi:sperm flagellar protein 2-like [Pristis pectinata]|uniref:sperm flagellar protein 2-like n=1 Tax=Pristis pectinata TaxID=685728 RepID=UPI00223D0958|nr:sperm flagellar protein 2-like [Pristis pectinata]
MTEILCRWLNDELRLSRRVEPRTFAKEFSTGYLIGEILNKHQLQGDFDQFSQGRNAASQLNNFQRLLPTLQLLGVMISDNVVKALIEEQHGVATRLLYQIYIALRRKENAHLSKLAMETMRPPAAAKLASISAEMYKERLKSMIPREVDVVLRRVSDRCVAKDKEIEKEATLKDEQELQKQHSVQEEQQTQNLEKLHKAKRKNKELMAKIQATFIPISKKVPQEMARAIQKRKQELRKKEAEMFTSEITKFEKILRNLTPAGGEEESPRQTELLESPGNDLSRDEEKLGLFFQEQGMLKVIGRVVYGSKRLEQNKKEIISSGRKVVNQTGIVPEGGDLQGVDGGRSQASAVTCLK